MLRLRFCTDCQPRKKKGHPPQRTTGVARTSSSHPRVCGGRMFSMRRPGRNSPIATRRTGTVRKRLTRKRRVMSTSSGFSSSSAAAVRGSRAIPHLGQFPGVSRTTSGCMGQTHSVRGAGTGIPAGSRAMPHFGQLPGTACRISGCIGQVYSLPSAEGGVLADRSSSATVRFLPPGIGILRTTSFSSIRFPHGGNRIEKGRTVYTRFFSARRSGPHGLPPGRWNKGIHLLHGAAEGRGSLLPSRLDLRLEGIFPRLGEVDIGPEVPLHCHEIRRLRFLVRSDDRHRTLPLRDRLLRLGIGQFEGDVMAFHHHSFHLHPGGLGLLHVCLHVHQAGLSVPWAHLAAEDLVPHFHHAAVSFLRALHLHARHFLMPFFGGSAKHRCRQDHQKNPTHRKTLHAHFFLLPVGIELRTPSVSSLFPPYAFAACAPPLISRAFQSL